MKISYILVLLILVLNSLGISQDTSSIETPKISLDTNTITLSFTKTSKIDTVYYQTGEINYITFHFSLKKKKMVYLIFQNTS